MSIYLLSHLIDPFILFIEARSYVTSAGPELYAAGDDFELLVLLPLHPKQQDYSVSSLAIYWLVGWLAGWLAWYLLWSSNPSTSAFLVLGL